MATKLLEYTFNNTISDCIPQFIGLSSDGYTISDSVSDNITTRIINVNDGVSLPTRIWFADDSHHEGRSLLTLEYLDTSNINNMSMLFCYCNYLTSVNTIGWDTSKVTDMTLMFFLTSNLQNLTLSNFDITNCTSFHRMFEKSGIVELNFIGNSTNSSVGKNMSKMFADCNKLTKLSISNIPNINNMSWMFSSCSKLESLNLIGLDTSNCTDFAGMFYGCSSLTSLDLSSFNTSKANSMQQMFIGCNKITSLDLSSFDTSKVTVMNNMFQNCSSLSSLDLSSFNTSNVTTMQSMFNGCTSLTSLDLSSFNTSKVTNMSEMFSYDTSITNLDLSSFNTSKVTNMSRMFSSCAKLNTLDLLCFDTSKVTNMSEMFSYDTSMTNLDLSNFKITDACDTGYMFIDCTSLESIDLSNFNRLTDYGYVFRNNGKLKTIGLLYSSASVINLLLTKSHDSLFTKNGLTVYYYDADPSQLTTVNNVTFIKYKFPTTISLPPHISLHSLPDGTKDELDVKTGILTRRTNEIIVNESENWQIHSEEKTKGVFKLKISDNDSDNYFKNQLIINVICSDCKFKPVMWSDSWNLNYNCITGTSNMIYFYDFEHKTLNEFKQYLSENPIKVIYRMTPTTEKLILNHNHLCEYGTVLPKGAVDYYDVVNSKYHKNIGSVYLQGDETWQSAEEYDKCVRFGIEFRGTGESNIKPGGGLYCDNDLFPNIDDDSDVEHCRYASDDSNILYFYVDKTRLMSPDLIGWQIWQQENPYTMYFELADTVTLDKPYEELDPNLARWEMMDSVKEGIISYTSNNNDNLTLYPNMTYIAPSVNNFDVEMLEPNTTYTVYADNTGGSLNLGGNTSDFTSGSTFTSGENKWLTFNSSPDVENIMLIKGDTTDEVVPYFEGMQSVQMPVLRTVGKNLFNFDDYEWKQGGLNDAGYQGGTPSYSSFINVDKVPIEKIFMDINKKVYLTCKMSSSNGWVQVFFYDKNGNACGRSLNHAQQAYLPITLNVPKNAKFFRMQLSTDDISSIVATYNRADCVPYVPYKSNILSTPEDLELRGIGDVKDELNLLTGELTQRLINMSNLGDYDMPNYTVHDVTSLSSAPVLKFSFDLPFKIVNTGYGATNNLPLVCDKFKIIGDQNGYSVDRGSYVSSCGNQLVLHLIKEEVGLPTDKPITKAIVKEFLKENPIEVTCQLVEPIIKTVDLKCVNQAGEVIDNLCAFDDGTINLSSDTGLLPTTHYTVPSTNTFHLPSMKTGTRYTLKYPSASGSITIGDIKYNINSPSMLFTTPLTIVGDTSAIIFSDENPQDVMLIEGAYNTREIPLFTGVKSVVNPTINIIDNGTEESRTYRCQEEVELRSLPNGVADKLDIVNGKLTRAVGIRPYQDGDEDLPNTLTDGYNTIYQLSKPTVSSVTFVTPVVTSDSTMHLSSEALIPQLNYRVPSNNNFPLDLLEPNKTYTLYANTLVSGSYTLGGTHNGYFTGTEVITLGDVTNNLLTFDGDLGLSDVVLIKGNSMNSELPYFEGLKTVENATITIAGMQEENSIILDDSITLRACGDIKDTIDMINLVMTQRLSEITLKGTEPWSLITTNESINDEYVLFGLVIGGIKSSVTTSLVCDKFNHKYQSGEMHNQEGIYAVNNQLRICVKKTTIGGETVDAIKTWLGQNNTRVIYALINPIEYQLQNSWTSTPPTSYNNRTTISSQVVDSLKPMISVTIATTTLEEIVSNLEARNTQLEEENLATMLALTSVYETMVAPMAVATMSLDDEPSTVNLSDGKDGNNINGMSVSPIGMVYVNLIRKGLKTIEQVPYNLQPEVMYALRGME